MQIDSFWPWALALGLVALIDSRWPFLAQLVGAESGGLPYRPGLSSVNSDLRVSSPMTANQIDKALQELAPAMRGLGSAFKEAEAKHRVNAEFLTALAIHESGRGTSRIAQDKRNLFGWGAYDATPYDSAWTFTSFAAGIDTVAGRIRALYFNSWNLTTLKQMNTKYATDQAWHSKIFAWVQRLQQAGG